MLMRMLAALAALVLTVLPVEARRVALVIGQDAYHGKSGDKADATAGLPPLDNPSFDAERMAKLLAKHGFDVIKCHGSSKPRRPGCYDLDRKALLAALGRLEAQAKAADLALVFFAGHGVATDEGNVLTPTDAKVNCATWGVSRGILVEQMLNAASPARNKLVILDACRNNPLGEICPPLKGKNLSFKPIEPRNHTNLLLVTSTQFGQVARDGPPGQHSPFAASLFAALEANPSVYFEQVFNDVAKATFEAAGQLEANFSQIPGKVVGGAAPADCLAGKGCVGDTRMAALGLEIEGLKRARARDQELAAPVRDQIAREEKARGRPFDPPERERRERELTSAMRDLVSNGDAKGEVALERFKAGDTTAAERFFTEALEADEKAAADIERIALSGRRRLPAAPATWQPWHAVPV